LHPKTHTTLGVPDSVELQGEVDNDKNFYEECDGSAEGIHFGMKRKKRRREIHSRGKGFIYLYELA
jgi:hypothetical protein